MPTLLYRRGILGRNWDKNLKTFAQCYSQSPQPGDFTSPYGFLGLLGFLQATAESGWGLVASKGGKPDRKPYHLYGFRNSYTVYQ